jgi:hypothetical protein
MRDFMVETTTRIDGPPLSGPECSGAFIRSNAISAYFWTQARLANEDTAVASCGGEEGGDVYRYDIAGGSYECLTCGPWGAVNITLNLQSPAGLQIAVSPDGLRLYFKTTRHLLPGANEEGEPGLYRLATAGKELAYVGPIGAGEVGDAGKAGEGISNDGLELSFASSNPALDALTDSNNAASTQYYLYDDEARTLLCVSCKQNGEAPTSAVPTFGLAELAEGVGPNQTALAQDGTFAFATPTPLVSADQNTAASGQSPLVGTDVYEWRDGRQILVSDGLDTWPTDPTAVPKVTGIDRSGHDVFFLEAAQLTHNALDGYKRLYDARIGGGFEEPTPPQPCALEACQGTPKGTPGEAPAGSASFAGPGNEAPKKAKKHKKKRHRKAKQRKRAERHAANNQRRTTR